MSCVSSIRRRRRLTLARSSAHVSRSNVNPFIGNAGHVRTEDTYHLFLNSAYRKNDETSSNFTIKFPDGPDFPVNSIVKFHITNASIPYSFYTFENEKINFEIKSTLNGVRLLKGETVLNGNYTAEELNDITVQFTYVIAGQYEQVGTVVALKIFKLNENLNKFQYDARLLNGLVFIYSDEITISCSENVQLKLGLNSTSSTINIFDYFPNHVNFISRTIFIRCQEPLVNCFESVPLDSQLNSNCEQSDVLAMIPVDIPPGNMITYINEMYDMEVYLRRDLKEIKIRLTDENDKELNLNGLDWSFCLKVTCQSMDMGAR